MQPDCLFCKIIKGEVLANIIYQDDLIIAFDDIYPKAAIHKLITPKQHIETLNDLKPEHSELMGHMMLVVKKIARDLKIEKSGYRIVINCNKDAGQVIFHLHLHLLGGQPLGWTPG